MELKMKNIRELIFNEGIEVGKDAAKIRIAINLLEILNDETIAERCDLSLEKVKQLRNDCENE